MLSNKQKAYIESAFCGFFSFIAGSLTRLIIEGEYDIISMVILAASVGLAIVSGRRAYEYFKKSDMERSH
jgi:hypothetical protein